MIGVDGSSRQPRGRRTNRRFYWQSDWLFKPALAKYRLHQQWRN